MYIGEFYFVKRGSSVRLSLAML